MPNSSGRARRARRSNWALRLGAGVMSVAAFLGFWQGARLSTSARAQMAPQATPGVYAPPSSGQGGELTPTQLGSPHTGTHVS